MLAEHIACLETAAGPSAGEGQQQPHQAPPAPCTPAQQRRQRQQHGELDPPLSSLLPRPPDGVLAAFAATKQQCRRGITAAAGRVFARQQRWRPAWPLDPNRDDPATAAMLVTLRAS